MLLRHQELPCGPFHAVLSCGHLSLTAPSSSSTITHVSCTDLPFCVLPEHTPFHQTPPDLSHPEPWLLLTPSLERPASLFPWLTPSPRTAYPRCCLLLPSTSSLGGPLWPCSIDKSPHLECKRWGDSFPRHSFLSVIKDEGARLLSPFLINSFLCSCLALQDRA